MVGRQARHQTKSLRDFVWWEDFNLGRDVLCNGRATDKQKNKSDRSLPYRRRGFPGGGGLPLTCGVNPFHSFPSPQILVRGLFFAKVPRLDFRLDFWASRPDFWTSRLVLLDFLPSRDDFGEHFGTKIGPNSSLNCKN